VAYAWIGIHLIISPLSVPFRSLTMFATGYELQHEVDSLPKDPGITTSDLVVVSTTSDFNAWHIPIMRSSLREPVPRHTWALTVGPFETELRRLDKYTLEIRPERGFVPNPWGRMFRGWSYPFKVGQIIQLEGLRIKVVRITKDGRPLAVQFRFDKPLEDPSRRFVIYDHGVYVPFTIPPIGKTIVFQGPTMFGLNFRAERTTDTTKTASRGPSM